MTRARTSTRAVFLIAAAFCIPILCLPETNADISSLSTSQHNSLKIILTVTPNATRRGGVITITAQVEKDGNPAQDAVAKILLTFFDGRQRYLSGTSDANGVVTCIVSIPLGSSAGPARVDVMIRFEGAVAIESSFFTVK